MPLKAMPKIALVAPWIVVMLGIYHRLQPQAASMEELASIRGGSMEMYCADNQRCMETGAVCVAQTTCIPNKKCVNDEWVNHPRKGRKPGGNKRAKYEGPVTCYEQFACMCNADGNSCVKVEENPTVHTVEKCIEY